MKRKLDAQNVPMAVDSPANTAPLDDFRAFDLDARILLGVQKAGYDRPTAIQKTAITSALQGRDIIARSKTGSGKTVAYVVPILQSILKHKVSNPSSNSHTACIVLVPTKELAAQVTKVFESVAAFCSESVKVENITQNEADAVRKARLSALPDVVVSTPGRVVAQLDDSTLSLQGVKHLVIDEADLILSYDFKADLDEVAKSMPQGAQSYLMSATIRTEIEALETLFCRDPHRINLDEEEAGTNTLSQFVVQCAEDEKFLLFYAIFMLKLIKGKTIVFVSGIERCYRLKLFLEQFGIRSCVLNSELPVNSRIHVVEEFNKNVYSIIIATDEHEVLGERERSSKKSDKANANEADENNRQNKADEDGNALQANGEHADDAEEERPRKKKRPNTRDKDYGVARGIDFKNVACVLNFDLPESSKSYTHRVGRTARAGNAGMALSFVIPKECYRKHKFASVPSTEHDEKVLARITAQQEKKGTAIQPYKFDMKRLEGFRYRVFDALKAVTGMAVKQARVREIRQELIKSEKLKRHFEENPGELQHLRHDGELRSARVQGHLKHVPEYLMSAEGKSAMKSGKLGFVGLQKNPLEQNRIRKARLKARRGRAKSSDKRKSNPLQTFRAKRK